MEISTADYNLLQLMNNSHTNHHMPDSHIDPASGKYQYQIIGRDERIDLTRYTVAVHGRSVIDYAKLRREDPTLYDEILAAEKEIDSSADIE